MPKFIAKPSTNGHATNGAASTLPGVKSPEPVPSRVGRDSRDRRDFEVCTPESPVARVSTFLSRYMVLPPESVLVMSAWIVAAWMIDRWDRFPHLAITS